MGDERVKPAYLVSSNADGSFTVQFTPWVELRGHQQGTFPDELQRLAKSQEIEKALNDMEAKK